MESKDLQWALGYSMNMAMYPDVFDLNIGTDFHLDEHPDWYPKVDKQSDYRTVKIEVSSFRGICADAVHYYARLIADGVCLCNDEIDKDGSIRTHSHFGYLGEEYNNLPREKKAIWDNSYEIKISRPLTQDEINRDPNRWKFYFPGDKTNAFDDKTELIEIAMEVAKLRFPDWKIELEDSTY